MAVRFETFDVDGLNMFYRSAGDPGAPAVLLLHGFHLACPGNDEIQLDRLGDDRTNVARRAADLTIIPASPISPSGARCSRRV